MDSIKNEIITKIRDTITSRNKEVIKSNDPGTSIFHKNDDSAIQQFTCEFERVNGEIILCDNDTDIAISLKKIISQKKIKTLFCIDPQIQQFPIEAKIPYLTKKDYFNSMDAGFTGCEFLIAQTGSIMVSSAQNSGRRLNVFPPIHIIFAEQSQIVKNLEDGIIKITKKYSNNLPSMISTITGPSRTADIEKTLVMGAHGPKEVVVLIKLEKK